MRGQKYAFIDVEILRIESLGEVVERCARGKGLNFILHLNFYGNKEKTVKRSILGVRHDIFTIQFSIHFVRTSVRTYLDQSMAVL